jgi:methylthioribose-1-phosphate isomerase
MTRGRVTVFVIAALLVVGIAFGQLSTGEHAGQPRQHRLNATIDHLHQTRPAAANVQLVAARRSDATPQASPVTAAASVQTLPPEAVAYLSAVAELQRQFFAAVQQAALRNFFESVYIQQGWAQYGRVLGCIRDRESHGNYQAVNRRSRASGAFQFLQGTWNNIASSAGRSDLVGVFPAYASQHDQDFLAIKLYEQQGYGPWQGGRRCR